MKRYVVIAFSQNPLTQEVYANTSKAAIDLALSEPNRWKIPTPSDGKAEWHYYAMPIASQHD